MPYKSRLFRSNLSTTRRFPDFTSNVNIHLSIQSVAAFFSLQAGVVRLRSAWRHKSTKLGCDLAASSYTFVLVALHRRFRADRQESDPVTPRQLPTVQRNPHTILAKFSGDLVGPRSLTQPHLSKSCAHLIKDHCRVWLDFVVFRNLRCQE